jgi:hypothetical protein
MQISGSSTLRTPVSSAEEAVRLIAKGNKLRATSSTNLNERSSRSHTVISFEIVSQDMSADSVRVGKINLVDLAGYIYTYIYICMYIHICTYLYI